MWGVLQKCVSGLCFVVVCGGGGVAMACVAWWFHCWDFGLLSRRV